MFVVDRRRTTSVVGAALVLGAMLGGCGGSGSSPTVLPPLSTTPSASQSAAPAQDLKAAAVAVVKQYFQLINNLPHDMDFRSLAALMTETCVCQEQVRAVKRASDRGEHYIDHWSHLTLAPAINGPNLVDVLAEYDAAAGGLVDKEGHRKTSAPAQRGVKRLFRLELQNGTWRIYRISAA